MTPTERETLIKVRNGLASGEYVHVNDDHREAGKRILNMEFVSNFCGTVACIGGWMAKDMGIEERGDVCQYVGQGGQEGDLRKLFYPGLEHDYESITLAEAVQAIDNVLADGDPRWREIVETCNVDC